MFNCYLHGWSSRQEACPLCHPMTTWTSNDTFSGIPPHLDKSLLEEIDTLKGAHKSEIYAYRSMLREIDVYLCEKIIDPCGYDPEKESHEDLVAQIKHLSKENEEKVKQLRVFLKRRD